MKRYLLLMLSAAAVVVLPSCTTTGAAGGMDNGPAVQARNAAIAGEPRGDWYVGRRYFTEKCRYWGYLRKPGQTWETAQLVVMDEGRGVLTPDRVSEMPSGDGRAHGFDHNYEYRVWGTFTGRRCYDPNADLQVPVFAARKYEVVSARPGFLFSPKDRYDPRYLPAREAGHRTESRR